MVRILAVALICACLGFGQATVRARLGTSSAFTDGSGYVWAADTACEGGTAFTNSNPIAGTTDDDLYQTGRAGTGAISCTYTVTSPNYYAFRFKIGRRLGETGVFSIRVNGAVATTVDLSTQCVVNTSCDVTTGAIAISTGRAIVALTQTSGTATLSAVEITGGSLGSGWSDNGTTLTTDRNITTTGNLSVGSPSPAVGAPAGSINAKGLYVDGVAVGGGATPAAVTAARICVISSSSSTAYVGSTTPAMTSYPAGVEIRFTANQTSGAAPTLDCGGGALAIRDALAAAAVPTGFLENGYTYTLRSNGTYWLLQEPAPGASGEKFLSSVIVGKTSGSNLATNGTFNADLTGWSGTNWAWQTDGASGGWARHTTGSTSALLSPFSPTAGVYYKVQFTIGGRTAGSVVASAGNFTYTATTATNGTYTFYFYAVTTNGLQFAPTTTFDGYIDDVSTFAVASTRLTADELYSNGKIWMPESIQSVPMITTPNYPTTGWASYYGTWRFIYNGVNLLNLAAEGGDTSAAYIQGVASNRLTIGSDTALVLRSSTSHIEIEGATGGTQVEILGYKGGTAIGEPIVFKTEPTSPATPIIAIQQATGQTGDLFRILASNGATVNAAFDVNGNLSLRGGTNILYRCSVAGTLKAGEMTTVSTDCGTAVDTGLRVP